MSIQRHYNDTSLNNEPERDARQLAYAGISSIGQNETNEIEDTEKNDAPINKQGDTFGGGISFHNRQVQ